MRTGEVMSDKITNAHFACESLLTNCIKQARGGERAFVRMGANQGKLNCLKIFSRESVTR